MSAVATKPRTKAARSESQANRRPQIPTPIEPQPFFWLQPTKLALRAISKLLDTAVDLDLPEDDTSNYACRVVQIARDMVSKEAAINDLASRSMARNEVANVAFDVFALLTAALNFPNEPLGRSRIPLLEHARAIADRLGDFHCYGTEASDPGGAEALSGLQRAIEGPPAELRAAATVDSSLPRPGAPVGDPDPSSRVAEAVAVLLASAHEHGRAEVWGVHSLAKLIERTLDSADPEDADDLQDVSNLLEQVLAVIEKVNDQALDCMLLHAGTSLLTTAKQLVDDKCEAVS